jgi:hypothetical protein
MMEGSLSFSEGGVGAPKGHQTDSRSHDVGAWPEFGAGHKALSSAPCSGELVVKKITQLERQEASSP